MTKEVHETIVRGLREDVAEVRQAVNKLVWGVVTLFVGIVVQIFLIIATRGSISLP